METRVTVFRGRGETRSLRSRLNVL